MPEVASGIFPADRPDLPVGGLRTLPQYALGLSVPLAVGFLLCGAAWLTDLVGFQGGAGALLVGLISAATWITIYGFIFTAGEEIGWRGYMLTRLIDAGVPRPVLASGLIWAFWHVPLILAGIYAAGPYPALSAVLFIVAVTSAAFVFARMRLETGSIWPVIFAHSAWNSIIQGPFDGATMGANAAPPVGPRLGCAPRLYSPFADKLRSSEVRRLRTCLSPRCYQIAAIG